MVPVDPSLHHPDTQLLDKLKDVYVESTTNVITVSIFLANPVPSWSVCVV